MKIVNIKQNLYYLNLILFVVCYSWNGNSCEKILWTQWYTLNLHQKTKAWKIIISKFIKIKPRHCVLAGSSGTHNVCVYVQHENFKLMLNEINIKQRILYDVENYYDYLDSIVCPDSSSSCHLVECENCHPDTSNLKNNM